MTIVEKALLLAMMSTAIDAALLASPDSVASRLAPTVLLPVGLVGIGCSVLVAMSAISLPLPGGIRARLERSARSSRLVSLWGAISLYSKRRDGLVFAALATLPLVALVALRLGLLFVAVGASLPTSTLVWVGLLVFTIQTLPISVAGIGVRESAFAIAFDLYGLDIERGVLAGLLLFSQNVLLGLVGWGFELADRPESPADA